MKRLNNLFTTLIGFLIIVTVLLFVYKGKTTFTEASGFLTIGIALLFSKDEQFSKNFLPFLYKDKMPGEPGIATQDDWEQVKPDNKPTDDPLPDIMNHSEGETIKSKKFL